MDEARLVVELIDRSASSGPANITSVGADSLEQITGSSLANEIVKALSIAGLGGAVGAGSVAATVGPAVAAPVAPAELATPSVEVPAAPVDTVAPTVQQQPAVYTAPAQPTPTPVQPQEAVPQPALTIAAPLAPTQQPVVTPNFSLTTSPQTQPQIVVQPAASESIPSLPPMPIGAPRGDDLDDLRARMRQAQVAIDALRGDQVTQQEQVQAARGSLGSGQVDTGVQRDPLDVPLDAAAFVVKNDGFDDMRERMAQAQMAINTVAAGQGEVAAIEAANAASLIGRASAAVGAAGPVLGVLAGSFAVGTGIGAALNNEMARAIDLSASYSADLSAAMAESQVASIQASQRTALRLGDEAAEYIRQGTRISVPLQELRDIAVEPLLQDMNAVLKTLADAVETLAGVAKKNPEAVQFASREAVKQSLNMLIPGLGGVYEQLMGTLKSVQGQADQSLAFEKNPIMFYHSKPLPDWPPPFTEKNSSKTDNVQFVPMPGLSL